MKVAYEHVRLKPDDDLASELMEKSLDDERNDIVINEEDFENDNGEDGDAEIFRVDPSKDLEEDTNGVQALLATVDDGVVGDQDKDVGLIE